MAERTGARPDSAADAEDVDTPDLPPIKHCFVTDAHGRLPALLLEWRRGDDGFEGRAVRPVSEAGGWIVVEEWLPAGMLEPA